MDFLKSIPFMFLLPLILLGLQFSLKFFIDRRATALNFATAILEVPINMLFVTLALLSALIIAGNGDIQTAFIFFLAILSIVPFTIFFWRRSVEHLGRKYFFWCFGLGFINLTISLPIIIGTIYFLMNN